MLGIDEDLEIRELTTKEKIKEEIIPMIIFTISVVSMVTVYLLYEHNRNIPMHREIMVGNKKISVKFDRKLEESLYYVDKENNKYIFRNNELVGYLKN